MIIAVVGYPGTGKTTYADKLAIEKQYPIIHADDYLHLPHSLIPAELLHDLEGMKDVVIEGTHVTRLFAKGFTPDLLVYMYGGTDNICPSIEKMIDNDMSRYGVYFTMDCVDWRSHETTRQKILSAVQS